MSININETVIKQGVIQCKNHEWVHDNNTMVLTCNPPIHVHKKICSKCGQIVEVREQTIINNTYENIYNKFHVNKDDPHMLKNLNWSINKDNAIMVDNVNDSKISSLVGNLFSVKSDEKIVAILKGEILTPIKDRD